LNPSIFFAETKKVLCGNGKRPSTQENRGRFNVKRSIKDRPQEVENRKIFGHWELDTMVSSRGQSKGCLATFVERKTRFYVAIKMDDRTKDSMFLAISSLYNTLTSKLLNTFTVDRGKDFACHNRLKTSLEYQCILPILMQHGNEVLMKIVMVYFENFSLRKPT